MEPGNWAEPAEGTEPGSQTEPVEEVGTVEPAEMKELESWSGQMEMKELVVGLHARMLNWINALSETDLVRVLGSGTNMASGISYSTGWKSPLAPGPWRESMPPPNPQ